MKKILVTGSNGLLGQSLVNLFNKNNQVLCCDLTDAPVVAENPSQEYYKLDISSRDDVKRFFSAHQPDIIINTAAYTDVDKSEVEKDKCWASNVRGVEVMIEAVKTFMPIFVQISSDYIFNGTDAPYKETDKTSPLGYYGHTKLSAEKIVRSSGLEYIIARTMILYGAGHNISPNFVTWVTDQLTKKNNIRVVNDQIGNPTFVGDLSEALFRLIGKNEFGIFHISGSEVCSRYEFALKIAKIFRLDKSLINEINTKELNQKAARPANTSFVLNKLSNKIDWLPPSIETSLLKLKKQMDLSV